VGGHPYWYYVPYAADLQSALDKLRAREFAAGRYSPVIRYIKFSEPAFSIQKPGKQHRSIATAIKASTEEGTRSILDIAKVGQRPDYRVAGPLPAARMRELYGTDKPTREMLDGHEFFEDIERGKCVYVVVHAGDKPSELMFAGYSYD
jgi:hypothetical protein